MSPYEITMVQALHEVLEQRDREWIIAIGGALGTHSGFSVPVVPSADAFRELFLAIRERAVKEIEAKALRALIPSATDTPSDAEPLL